MGINPPREPAAGTQPRDVLLAGAVGLSLGLSLPERKAGDQGAASCWWHLHKAPAATRLRPPSACLPLRSSPRVAYSAACFPAAPPQKNKEEVENKHV